MRCRPLPFARADRRHRLSRRRLAAAQAPAPARTGSEEPSCRGRRSIAVRRDRQGRATAARKAEQWEQAVDLYGKAVKLRPAYTEGIWYQGAAYYSLDKFAECRDAFRRVTRAAPTNGAAFAFLGLCEFGLRSTIARSSTW